MTSVSFLNTNTNTGGGGSAALPTSQPAQPGLWLNAGVLTLWTGTQNQLIDTTANTEPWNQANW